MSNVRCFICIIIELGSSGLIVGWLGWLGWVNLNKLNSFSCAAPVKARAWQALGTQRPTRQAKVRTKSGPPF